MYGKMKNRTTIQLPREIKNALKRRKKFERETYADLIKRLIKKDKKKLK